MNKKNHVDLRAFQESHLFWPDSFLEMSFVKQTFATDPNSDSFHLGYRMFRSQFGVIHADNSFGLGLLKHYQSANGNNLPDSTNLLTSTACKRLPANAIGLLDTCTDAIGVCKMKVGKILTILG